MRSPPSTSLARGYIISAFALQLILCLKVPVEITCHVVYIQLFLLCGKFEMIFYFLLCICIFWRKIAVSLNSNIVSHIPGSKMDSTLYPWKKNGKYPVSLEPLNKPLKSPDCVASTQKSFALLFMKSLKYIISSPCAKATYLRWHAASKSPRYIQEISYIY